MHELHEVKGKGWSSWMLPPPPPPLWKLLPGFFLAGFVSSGAALYCIDIRHFWRITDNLERMFLRAYRALLYTPFSVCVSVCLSFVRLSILSKVFMDNFTCTVLSTVYSLLLFQPNVQLLSGKNIYMLASYKQTVYTIFILSILYCIVQLIHTSDISIFVHACLPK